MKSLCECAHNIMHNATASLLGSHGRDAAHMHESNRAVIKYSAEMIAQAECIDKALVPMLQLPILDYRDYAQYFYAIEAEVMDRTNHNLEGWGENEIMEYRLSETSDTWLSVQKMMDMSPEQIEATKAVIASNPMALMRKRKMSRREVWKAGQKELIRWPIFDVPAFFDPRDSRTAKVRADGTIQFEDAFYYPGEKKSYMAVMTNRQGYPTRLVPGSEVRFYWAPIGKLAEQIWIVGNDETILGMCPLLKTAMWTDEESIKAAMGQKAHQIAELMQDTRARNTESRIAKEAAERANAALLEAAKAVKSEPMKMNSGKKNVEKESPIDFLEGMNQL